MSVSRESLKGLLITFIYPFAGIIYTFRHIDRKEAEKWFLLICIYWGFAYIYYNGVGIFGEGTDSERYAKLFIESHAMRSISLSQYIAYLNKEDYYSAILLFAVSRVSGNPHVFFGVAALIMGWFMTRSAWIVINNCEEKKSLVYILIFAMLFAAPIWNIGFLRWWTALFIYLYGILSYLIYQKKISLIWCFLPVFVHYTFFAVLYVTIVYLIIPKRKVLPYLIVFVAANFVSSFDVQYIYNIIESLTPSAYDGEHIIGYMSFEYKASHNMFADSGRYVAIYTNLYMIVSFYLRCKKDIDNDDFVRKFFILTLLISSLCLFVNMAPWGRRFIDLYNFITYAFFCYVLSQKTYYTSAKILMNIAIPFLFYFILFQLRGGLYSIGLINLFVGNFFTVFFTNDNTPIIFYIDKIF